MCVDGGEGGAFQSGDTRQRQGVGRIAWGSVSSGHVGRGREGLGRSGWGERRWNVTKGPEILG